MSWMWIGTSFRQSLKAAKSVTYRISDGITLAAVVRPMTNNVPTFFMLRSPATNIPLIALSGAQTTGFSCWSRNGFNTTGATEINVNYTAGASVWYLVVGRIVTSTTRTINVFNLTTKQTWSASNGNGIDSTLRNDYVPWMGTDENQASSTMLFVAHAAIWNVPLNTNEMNALARGINPSKIQRERLLFYAPLTSNGRIVAGQWSSLLGAMNSAGQVAEWRENPPMIEPWRLEQRRPLGWMPSSMISRVRVAWFGRT